jgi:hypothetical protein
VGRHAPLAAALIVTFAADPALGVLLAVGIGAAGLAGLRRRDVPV